MWWENRGNAPGLPARPQAQKVGMDAADTSELFFDDVKLPPENSWGSGEERGRASRKLMNDLPPRAAHRHGPRPGHESRRAVA